MVRFFLETDLFNSGIRPAINAGLSVSRVGGAAQTTIIKKLGGGIRLALAHIVSLLRLRSLLLILMMQRAHSLELGERVTELMKQGQYSPLSVAEMAFSLFAANEGFLNDVDVKKVVDYEAAMLAHMKSNHGDLIAQINDSGDFSDDIAASMKSALEGFKANGCLLSKVIYSVIMNESLEIRD